MKPLRRRLERSALLAGLAGRLLAGWLRLCHRTTRWQRDGWDDLRAALAEGPVVLILWHECAAFAMVDWPSHWGPLTSLTDTSPAGTVSGAVQARLGLRPVAMQARGGNLAASRAVMRRLGEGVSVGLTGDGPTGPARVLKDPGPDWARATGRPVFLYAFATARARRLRTWDRMLWPRPFDRGISAYRRWDGQLPRRADAATRAAAQADIAAALTALTEDLERRMR